jgi:hypothetical protein
MIKSRTIVNKLLKNRSFSYMKTNTPNPKDPYNSSKIIFFITISIIYKTFIDNN